MPPSRENKPLAIPRPSSSVILVSPENQVLLLRRVRTSSSFPSAHVFPGGNVSPFHDGELPPPEDAARHQDSETYRLAAIRETFEESGILLAKNNGFGRLIEVDDAAREEGRHLVHSNKVDFRKWLAGKGGRADTENLIPFTRWVTPTNLPKRFSTQMYIYLLPLSHSPALKGASSSSDSEGSEVVIPDPTHDGGKEHTAARFLPPSTWLRLAQEKRIIMFPPQFFLLHMLSPFLSSHDPKSAKTPIPSYEDRQAQRKAMLAFLKTGEPSWATKVISPIAIPPTHGGKRDDGRIVLGLEKPGPELKGIREGEKEHVVLVEFKKEGPRRVEVRKRAEVLAEGREKSSL
ncbi:hypothetical protein CAC42_2884 [Sphaceloma murrayae]|uniref:Nudix hydrolase domain-containing protein n=1 Tax=Sphaceloma murrayae TaxID=2082308 RepID=A0A2K1R196_9PEZI|nr:hypothetical protein CAC42_2884 [Sphaceloma murrayae]